MMVARNTKTKLPVDPVYDWQRRRIFAAKKAAALEEDNYRALLKGATGKDSLRAMSANERGRAIEALNKLTSGGRPPERAGKRRLAKSPQAGKARALWLALYHFGEVEKPEESALDGFVRRQMKIASLNWLDVAQASQVIDALKAWLERAAGAKVPGDGLAAKRWLIKQQWKLLESDDPGAAVYDGSQLVALCVDGFCSRAVGRLASVDSLAAPDADRCIEKLGSLIRRLAARKVHAE